MLIGQKLLTNLKQPTMTRPHFYRAWDKEAQKMLTKDFLLCPTSPAWSPYINRSSRELERLIDNHLQSNGDPFGSGGCWIAEGGDYYGDNLIVMQYVGINDKHGKKIFDSDILKVKTKHGFNSQLLEEYAQTNKLDTINGIGNHFVGIVRLDFLRGLMFENPKNGYQEPMFSRYKNLEKLHSGIEVIGNIYQDKHLLAEIQKP